MVQTGLKSEAINKEKQWELLSQEMMSDLPLGNITLAVGWRIDGGKSQWKRNLYEIAAAIQVEDKEGLHSDSISEDGEKNGVVSHVCGLQTNRIWWMMENEWSWMISTSLVL